MMTMGLGGHVDGYVIALPKSTGLAEIVRFTHEQSSRNYFYKSITCWTSSIHYFQYYLSAPTRQSRRYRLCVVP